MANKPGRGGSRENSGRPKLFDEKTAPVRLPESIAADVVEATKKDRPAIEQILSQGNVISLDEFDRLPTYEWSVTEILPNPEGGMSLRSQMSFSGGDVGPVRSHIRSMVERGALKAGMIRQSSSHSIEVFFGHPGWGGDSVGYKINLARDEFNFTTLRQHLTKHLIAGEVDDFVGPVIVHQCDKETIEIVLDKNQLSLNLLRDPKVPSRYAAFEAPGSKTFTFDTSDAAQSACHLAQTIINRSSSYMEQVNEKWGLGKYQAI